MSLHNVVSQGGNKCGSQDTHAKKIKQDIQVTQNPGWSEVILDLNLTLPLGSCVNLANFISVTDPEFLICEREVVIYPM